jgi:hypothetical protein
MSVRISVSRAWGAVSSGNGREFDAFDEDELLDVLVDYHTGGDRVPDDAPPLWLRAGHHTCVPQLMVDSGIRLGGVRRSAACA